jgi:hypothetical protein
MTSRVIDHVQEMIRQSTSNEGLAFFYCDRTVPEQRDPLSVAQSYVRQLSTPANKTDKFQKSLLETCLKLRKEGSRLDFRTCKAIILESVNRYRQTTFILDGLDECEESSRGKLLDLLYSVQAKATNPFKLFIASRPDQDIRARFQGQPNIEIHAKHNEGDIKKFITERISYLGSSNPILLKMENVISEELIRRSDGM